jgi:uncharacterized protein YwgA
VSALQFNDDVNIVFSPILYIQKYMNMKLQDFTSFLHGNKLIDLANLLKVDEIGCVNRLKLQKYVYLAQTCLNTDFGYEYSVYNNGPYSPELANYYYETMDIDRINADIMEKNWKLDNIFTERFLNLIQDKDLEWLVIASTLIDSTNYFEDEQEILNKVYAIKSDYSKNYIDDVWNELKNKDLVQYESGLKLSNILSVF